MKHLRALVISKKEVFIKILNWELDTINSVENALAVLQQQDYKVIAIDSSVLEIEKQKLIAVAKLFNDKVSVVVFSKEEDLKDNIKQAFRDQKRTSFAHNYLDNAFEIELASKLKMNGIK